MNKIKSLNSEKSFTIFIPADGINLKNQDSNKGSD